ncbi:MAG: DNA polymerase III subunit delta [Candidatus Gastranaerophilales bacterium]|nr:DNA polymerase III subunit delta [Candidatus Gastranaerophilales bacterium]
MPIFLYWGDEDYTLEKDLQQLKSKTLDEAWKSLNYKKLNNPDLKTLIESLETVPMAFGNSMIEINAENFLLRGNDRPESASPMMKKLFEILENISPTLYIVFVCKIPRDTNKKIDNTYKLTKTISNLGEVKEFTAFKAYQEDKILIWLKNTAKSKETNIADDAGIFLIRNIGTELRKLDSELDRIKLAVYPEKQIQLKHVKDISSQNENVFILADYWLAGNKAKAICELNKLFEKDHPLKTLSALNSTLKRWLKIKIEAQTKNPFEISKFINLHEFVVKKDLEKLRKISIADLIKLKQNLYNCEEKIKTGQLNPEIALEMAVMS